MCSVQGVNARFPGIDLAGDSTRWAYVLARGALSCHTLLPAARAASPTRAPARGLRADVRLLRHLPPRRAALGDSDLESRCEPNMLRKRVKSQHALAIQLLFHACDERIAHGSADICGDSDGDRCGAE